MDAVTRRAWAYLSRVAEPPNPELAQLVCKVGAVEAADLVRRRHRITGGQRAGDRNAEDPAGHHHQKCDDEDAARGRDGQQGDALQHRGPPPGYQRRLPALSYQR